MEHDSVITGQEETYRRILETLPGFFCAIDREGTLLALNRELADVLGQPAPALAGKAASEVLDILPGEVMEIFYDVLASGKERRASIKWERPDSRPLQLVGIFQPFQSVSAPTAGGAMWTAHIRYQGEDELAVSAEEASRKKLKELLSVIRHDILNQLTILIGFLQYSEDFIDDPEVRDFLAREETAGTLIQRQIEFTREFQNLALEDPCWFSLQALIDSAWSRVDAGSVRIKSSAGRIDIFASPLMMKVFTTLIDNALTHGNTTRTIMFRTRREGEDLVLVCEDDGTGVPAEEKSMLFERGHGRNAGYGLWLAREILDITGAEIKEIGESGKGAKFEIRIPAGMWRRL